MAGEILSTNLIPAAEAPLGFRVFGSSLVGLSSALMSMLWLPIGSTGGYDSAGGLSLAAGNSFVSYTVPPNGGGGWQIQCNLKIAASFSLNNQVTLQLQRNGSAITQDIIFAQAAATDLDPMIADYIRLNAGDVLQIQIGSQGTTPTVAGSTLENYWSGTRVTT